jgi:hypothetical protein
MTIVRELQEFRAQISIIEQNIPKQSLKQLETFPRTILIQIFTILLDVFIQNFSDFHHNLWKLSLNVQEFSNKKVHHNEDLRKFTSFRDLYFLINRFSLHLEPFSGQSFKMNNVYDLKV